MTSRSYHCSCVFSHHLDHRRLQRLRTINSSSSSSSSSRRLNRSFVRKTTTNSSSEESSSEEQQKSSWKVVSESPFSNSSSTTTNNSTTNDNDTLEDSSLASEQPSTLRIEAESSSSSTRTTEENNVGEEKVGGIPINSSRRATKMLFTCNKCETRTERKVNKANLTTGTTWVQCGNPSCMVWHKIVDNLGLIYECSEME
ncbi:unnamed protein product [Bathycoccus prasinos]